MAVEKDSMLMETLRAEAKQRQIDGGKEHGRGQEKVRQQIAEPTLKSDDRKTTTQIAKTVGTNRQYIQDAVKIKKVAPDKVKDIVSGDKTITQVKREIKEADRLPVEWLKGCEVCNAGLCARFDELIADGLSQRKAAKQLEVEQVRELGEVVYPANTLWMRYKRNRGSAEVGTFVPKPENPTCAVTDLQGPINSGQKFGTIYADPPWSYSNQGTRAATNGIDLGYALMLSLFHSRHLSFNL